MPDSRAVLAVSDDLPIRTAEPVHSGKVRSVYWLDAADSARLIRARGYPVAEDAALGLMVISDRLSAFDCLWRAEGGLDGVPGKGAALNAIAAHWFAEFARAGLARSHILETPHPLLWVVQRAEPVAIEAIARQYITGSMWRAYARGERAFAGIELPQDLQRDQRLPQLLITPSTKGVVRGVPGVPELDDATLSAAQVRAHHRAFGIWSEEDARRCETLLAEGFRLIAERLAALGLLLVDTKFEFGYARTAGGGRELIYMDEVGTPDSSRIWEAQAYAAGRVVEHSKEGFRQALLAWVEDEQILLDPERMAERVALARSAELPRALFDSLAHSYRELAGRICGDLPLPGSDPRAELLAVLGDELDVLR
jgi:phosphoribosylaminoimidazole-succinocarboxamide synthase